MTVSTTDRNKSCLADVSRLEAAVATRAEMQLWHSSYCELRHVRCAFHEGVFTLRGILPSYYLKQIAQTIVSKADAACVIVNRIEVADPPARPEGKHSQPRTWGGYPG